MRLSRPQEVLRLWFDDFSAPREEHFQQLLAIVESIVREAQADEREACAALIDAAMTKYGKPGYPANLRKLAEAMRARGWNG